MKSQRQLQIGENIKRIMSEIFLREDILTIPGSYITILQADVSPDAKNVKIFIDIFGNNKMHEKIVAKLNEMAPFFRHQMAKKIVLRVMPEIVFILDKTQIQALNLEALIMQEAAKYQNPTLKKTSKKSPSKTAKKKKEKK
ncbi:MAG: 30S ribosome-binding factor RbfA [Rickettsiales bacterium]|nr:30S ribosome-binding factor RbfA [Rickettsiales bacterium]